ncbi:hypothetical protein ACLKA6_005613 [Drosophila palustris]
MANNDVAACKKQIQILAAMHYAIGNGMECECPVSSVQNYLMDLRNLSSILLPVRPIELPPKRRGACEGVAH